MSGRCLQCQFCCAVSRILCYQFCCCCLHKKKEPKQEIDIIMVGHQNAGKSHLLATLSNESTSDIAPTDGFSMKDIILDTSILHIKELGGSMKIIPYWKHYFSRNQSGIIYIVNGKTLEKKDNCDRNCATLREVLCDENLKNIPLLVLITQSEEESSENLDEVTAILELKDICRETDREFIVDFAGDLERSKETLGKLVNKITATDNSTSS